MAPDAYVTEDDLVGHQWEERSLVLMPSVGECQGGEVGMGGWVGEHPHRSRDRGVCRGKTRKGNNI